ncbi:hypothetical protein [Dactylosporangium sp. NPDC005555]|uniref:hypothetical protein n=1 Tax=Dactylosporangium sp. NPDC005555 TaxID=3154889 RepID=UPI0033A74448
MTDVVIDLDAPAPRTQQRRGVLSRAAAVAVLGLLAAAPATAPVPMAFANRLPVPSYCTGAPLPGGRLNIVEGDVYVLLDGQTGVVLSTGHCPRR